MNTEDFISTYCYGRCQFFAIVAAKLLGKKISVLWDTEAEDGEGGYIDEDCLVHAFIALNDDYQFDASGVNEFTKDQKYFEYPCNVGVFSEYHIDEFEKIVADKKWGWFHDGEYDMIELYIIANMPE
jgi:hypothetical protein